MGTKCCSRSTNEAVSSMGRLPCLGAYLDCFGPDRMPKFGKEADVKCRKPSLGHWPACEREAAESRVNVYAYDP